MEGSRYPKKRVTSDEDHQALTKTTTTNESDTVTDRDSERTVDSNPRGNRFAIDYSKNGKAKCKECKNAIAKGELRIGRHIPFKDTHILQYYHILCAFTCFKRARVQSSVISESNDIDGIENISDRSDSGIKGRKRKAVAGGNNF